MNSILRGFVVIVIAFAAGLAIAASGEREFGVTAGESGTIRRVALVIGNSAYPGAPLSNPVNDAHDMAAALRRLGFEVIEKTDASQKEMLRAIGEFGGKLRNDTVAMFFYAGHGMQIKGKNYMIPVDAQIQSEASAKVETVDVDGVLDQLSVSPLNIVILDACRNNPFERRFRSVSGGLAQMDAPNGSLIAYATAPGKVASDGTGRNGLYTQELLKHIQTPGLPIEAVFKRVRNGVMTGSGGNQTPWEASSLTGDFFFVSGSAGAVRPQQPALQPASSVTSARTAAQIEDELWDAIKESDKASVFEEYIKQYPKGRYFGQARVKIAALKELVKPVVATRPTTTAVIATTGPTGREDAETALWKAVETGSSKDDYQAYLVQYPKGKYIALAKSRVAKLDEQERQEAARKEQEALLLEQETWETVQRANSEEAYRDYQKRYPQGRYATLAAGRLKKLETDAALKAEANLWQKVAAAADSALVQDYLARYPNGRYVAEARIRLAAVKKEEAEMRPGKAFRDCDDCPEMVVIPPGSFDMGSNSGDAYGDETPVHHVTIVKSFALGRTEVTQGQWKDVMGNDPPELRFKDCGADCPVEPVSWNDAQEFIRKLSEKTGKTYRLPTEAEWEYACKAGGNATYCGGENINRVAWYGSNSGNKTHPVAGNQANAWGLYDMSGHVWEWVEDCWHDSYKDAPADGSAWTSSGCGNRVRRGGSWISTPRVARATIRGRDGPADRYGYFGFRLARTLP